MIIKIKRTDCLEKYPNFPLTEYDRKNDEEIFSYPDVCCVYWVRLESKTKRGLVKLLIAEMISLFRKLDFTEIVCLGETKYPWITKSSLARTDYKPLIEALDYFTGNKIGRRFNGGVQIESADFATFFKHLYYLTSCDATVPDINFMDTEQRLIGCIHYSGEVKFMPLDKEIDKLFEVVVSETGFQDSFRDGTSRLLVKS